MTVLTKQMSPCCLTHPNMILRQLSLAVQDRSCSICSIVAIPLEKR